MTKPILPTAIIEDRRKAVPASAGIDDRRIATAPRRAAPRMKTLKGAQIVVPVGLSVACVVRNISETGARLELQTPILSNTFDLVFDDNEWPRRACRVVWRKEAGIGVEFTELAASIVEVVAVDVVDVAGGPAKLLLPD